MKSAIFKGATATSAFLVAFFLAQALLPRSAVRGVAPRAKAMVDAPAEAETVELESLEGEQRVSVSEVLPKEEQLASTPLVKAPDAEVPTAGDSHVLLHGLVTNRHGEALENVWVHVSLPDGQRVSTRSDFQGRYALGPLPRGRHLLESYLRFHHSANVEVVLPTDREVKRQDLVLESQQVVRVRITTSEGEPALPALRAKFSQLSRLNLVPVATREDPGQVFTEVSGSLNNTFGIGAYGSPGYLAPEALYPDEYGSVTLKESAPAWISLVAAHQVLAKQRLQPNDEVVPFILDPTDIEGLFATVRAQVVDAETGASIAASAFLGDDPFHNGETRYRSEVSTGALLLEGQLPGRRWLVVEAEGKAPFKREIDVSRGSTVELGTIALQAPVSISGRTIDEEGQALEAVVEWGVLDEGSGQVDWATHTRARSDAAGRFKVARLEPGVYLVRSPGLPARPPRPHDASRAALPVRVDVRAQSVEGVELTLQATTRLTLASGTSEPPYAMARVFDNGHLPVRSAWLGRWGPEAGLDLVPGSYTLVVTREDEELLRRPLEIGDEPRRLELEL